MKISTTPGTAETNSNRVKLAPDPPDGTPKNLNIGALSLEAGGRLPDVTLAYETWGTLNADASKPY